MHILEEPVTRLAKKLVTRLAAVLARIPGITESPTSTKCIWTILNPKCSFVYARGRVVVIGHNSHGYRASTVLYPTADWFIAHYRSNNKNS